MSRRSLISLAVCLSFLVGFAAPPSCDGNGQAKFGDPEFECVGTKQEAAGAYSAAAFTAWARWGVNRSDTAREHALEKAGERLGNAFGWAEQKSSAKGVDCVEQTASAAQLEESIGTVVSDVVTSVRSGLDAEHWKDALCAKTLLLAAGERTSEILQAEAQHTREAPWGGAASLRDDVRASAAEQFTAVWEQAQCGSDASETEISAQLDALGVAVVFQTVVSPALVEGGFEPVSPVGPIEYEGRTLEPRCGFDNNSDYHFFVKRGSVNNLVVYYQGGGACWENLTCGIPVCKNGADPIRDDPDNASSGFANLDSPDNPFKDWNAVFVTYCTCDVHYGDADQVYSGIFGDVAVSHRGYENAKVVEKFAREHFLNPDEIFVTGSSAGAYGAVFHAPLLHDAWPASRFHVLGDAGNGVITPNFLQNEFENWNFTENIPDDIPGVLESLESGEGMVSYVDAVADFYPDTNWAHYSTSYDGGSGGQTGFYNVMLNGNNPIAALTWWGGSCQFNEAMVDQAYETSDRAPDNYRYYIGTGSRHTMWGNDKVYTNQNGGEEQTIVAWVEDMIAHEPGASDPSDWQNVECTDCGLVQPGDPTPPVIPTAPFFDDAGETVIVCED